MFAILPLFNSEAICNRVHMYVIRLGCFANCAKTTPSLPHVDVQHDVLCRSDYDAGPCFDGPRGCLRPQVEAEVLVQRDQRNLRLLHGKPSTSRKMG